MPPRTTWLGLVVAVAVAPALAGCNPGDARSGMKGRQLLRAHDVADVSFPIASTVAFTRRAENPSDETPQDFWTLDLSGDAPPTLALAGIDWAPPTWWPRLQVGSLLMTGTAGRRFYDFDEERAADLLAFGYGALVSEDGTSFVLPPYPALTAIRRDGGAIAITGGLSNQVGVGRPADLQTFSLEGAVASLDFLGEDLALLYSPTGRVAGELDATLGIYRMSTTDGAMTPLVEPSPAEDWYQPACQPFELSPCARFKVVGCNAGDAPCPGSGKPPCLILYARAERKEGVTTPEPLSAYAYDVQTGASFWLPGVAPQAFAVSPDQHMMVWQSTVGGGGDRPAGTVSRFWDLCSNTETVCPESQASQLVWRPGGGGFSLLDYGGSLLTADSASGECKVASDLPVYQVQYSPAGDRLLILVAQENDGSLMVVADAQATSFTQIASGSITGARFSPDGQRVIAARGDASTVSLSWFDLTTTPPEEHRMVDNYGGFSRGGGRRALLVDHWNSQDSSGDLVLMDMASGERQLLGKAVTEFAVLGDLDGADAQVAYVVRSRVASERDGLWLTALPP